MALTLKQRRFIDAYLGEANGNATRAARIAGYATPHMEGHNNLKNPKIVAEIERRYRENTMSTVETLRRLADQARGVGAYISVQDGRTVVDVQGILDAGLGHLIKAVKHTKYGQEIEFYDAQNALIQIGKHLRLFVDRQEITTDADTAAAIAAAASALHSKLAALAERAGADSDSGDIESDGEGGAPL